MISKCSQDGTLQGREGQAIIKATVSVLDSECVYEYECVHTEPFGTCRTKPAIVATSFANLNQTSEVQSLSTWLNNILIKRRRSAACQLCC